MFIIFMIISVLIIFGIYKLCIFLNTNPTEKKENINNLILKIGLSITIIIILFMIKNGLDGYFNGSEGFACMSIIGDCYYYGLDGMSYKIIKTSSWMFPLLIVSLTYILIYKIKYKKPILKKKFIFFILFLIIGIIINAPIIYNIINQKIFFLNNDYKYELEISGFDYYIYIVDIYDERINVIKKEQPICIQSPCKLIKVGEYTLEFNKESMEKISKFTEDIFYDNSSNYLSLRGNDNLNEEQQNIIKSIINNDETILQQENKDN